MTSRRSPGVVRDAIVAYLRSVHPEARHIAEIHAAVCKRAGNDVPKSSVRSYLRLNTPKMFTRTGRGLYKMSKK